MSLIKSYRKRTIQALEKHFETLDLKDYQPQDYDLDTFARLCLSLAIRPENTPPYEGWLSKAIEPTNNTGKGFCHIDFSNFARYEASKRLTWNSAGEARKYTRPFESLGFKGRFPWCSAFVHWLMNHHGVAVPIMCKEYPPYSYALAESWQQMGIIRGFYHDNDAVFSPRIGDIVLFDWQQRNIHHPDNRWEDHIGIFLETVDNTHCLCAEGNSGNESGLFRRKYVTIKGYVRIPEGTEKL